MQFFANLKSSELWCQTFLQFNIFVVPMKKKINMTLYLFLQDGEGQLHECLERAFKLYCREEGKNNFLTIFKQSSTHPPTVPY